MAKFLNVFQLVFTIQTLKKASFTALIVGSILIMINHWETLVKLEMPNFWKLILTYLVPFCVTIWGRATVKLEDRWDVRN